MKKIIPKILLVLSFTPYAIALFYGINSAVNGWTLLFGPEVYGFEAFMDSSSIMLLCLCYVPILPPCLIYQLIYLAVFIMKKLHVSKTKMQIISGFIAAVILSAYLLIYANINN